MTNSRFLRIGFIMFYSATSKVDGYAIQKGESIHD